MNVLIVEDESHTALLLKELIEQSGEFLVVTTVDSIVDAVDYLARHQQKLDLLFFDIQLADGLSFEIFKHVDITTPIIFCTAFDDYAMDAIKNNGINYILKPFKNEDVQQALAKFQVQWVPTEPKTPVAFKEQETQYQKNFLCQYKERTMIVKHSDIACFSITNQITYLHNFQNGKYPIFKKLDYIESVCDPTQFFRINRQMLVNRAGISSYEPYFNRKISLQLSIEVEEPPVVSRLKVTEFLKWLEY